jgi:hypothetical protein
MRTPLAMLTEPLNDQHITEPKPTIKDLASMGDVDPRSVEMRISGFGLVPAVLIAALCQARDVRSPNGSYAIRVENRISLVDLESGSVLLVLDQDASGESLVEVAWPPNSMNVAIVEDEARGSVVPGAWTDERSIPADMASDPQFLKGPSDVVGRPATWHKTIQNDNEKAIFSEAQRRFGGSVVAESRVFAGWRQQ